MADGSVVKRLMAVFDADTSGGTKALQGIQDETKKTGGFFSTAAGALVGFASGTIVLSAVADGFNFLKSSVQEYMASSEEMQANAQQTAAVIKSTGGVAGVTAQQVDDLATSFAMMTPYSDEATHSAENILLTYDQIGSKVFPGATQATEDLAARFNIDLSGAAKIVGRALEDPIKGVTALSRYTGVLTDKQLASIKAFQDSGNIAAAQGVILDALKEKVGGAAQAAGQTFTGALSILGNQFDQLKQQIGGPILDGLTQLLDIVIPLVPSLGGGLSSAVGQVAGGIKTLTPLVSDAANFVAHLFDVGSKLVGLFLAGFKPSLDDVGKGFGGVSLNMKDVDAWFKSANAWVDSLVPLAAQAVVLGQEWGTRVKTAFDNVETVWNKVWPLAKGIAETIASDFTPAVKALTPEIAQGVSALGDFAGQIETKALPAAKMIFEYIQIALPIVEGIWNAVWPAMSAFLGGVWQVIKGIVETAFALVSGTIKFWLDVISGNWSGAWNDILGMLKGIGHGLSDILGGLVQVVVSGAGGMVTAALNALGHLPGGFGDAARNAGKALGDGLGNMGGYVAQAAQNLASGAVSAVKHFLGIRSPSTVFAEMGQHTSQGFIQGVKGVDVSGAVAAHFAGVPDAASSALTGSASSSSAASAASAALLATSSASAGRMLRVAFDVDSRELAHIVAPAIIDEIRLATGVMS